MMGNRLNALSNIFDRFKKKKLPLPIETSFKLPSQLPSWPPGDQSTPQLKIVKFLMLTSVGLTLSCLFFLFLPRFRWRFCAWNH